MRLKKMHDVDPPEVPHFHKLISVKNNIPPRKRDYLPETFGLFEISTHKGSRMLHRDGVVYAEGAESKCDIEIFKELAMIFNRTHPCTIRAQPNSDKLQYFQLEGGVFIERRRDALYAYQERCEEWEKKRKREMRRREQVTTQLLKLLTGNEFDVDLGF